MAVTVVITAFAWSVGWRLPGITLLLLAVLVGQPRFMFPTLGS